MPSFRPSNVVIVGGGLAGIAAATACATAGLRVVLLESRRRLGGRATSYLDRASGESIDNCQHVSMGCCTQLRHLCETLGIAETFETIERLHFVAPDGRVTDFVASRMPAPLHLAGAFLGLPYLSWREKLLFARGVKALAGTPVADLRGRSFHDWLLRQGQTENLIRNAWELVLISALSESIERIDAAYAHKVFIDGFLAHRRGWQVEIPRIPLDELYSRRAYEALTTKGVEVRLGTSVEELILVEGFVRGVRCGDGNRVDANDVVCAVPQHHLSRLLAGIPALAEQASTIAGIESAPITSVHLWFDRRICPLPHAVLVGRFGHWLFDRGERTLAGRPVRYHQVVMSASRKLDGWSEAAVTDRVVAEIRDIWHEAGAAELLHSRVVTERRAVFSAVPGIDRLRPGQQTAIDNLQLAGDWTQTGWPATMEGAVRSGYLAAENILRRHELPIPPAVPDLPVAFLAGLLMGIPRHRSNRPT